MVKQLYSINDVKVCVFYPPMCLLNDNEARRTFSDIISNPETSLAKHPEDYRLFRIGEFNDNSGELSTLAQPEFLCNAVEFISVKAV